MRRASSSNSFEVVVKAPTLGLYTRIPGEQPDPRAATAASNVRFAEGVAMNAPGYGVLVTSPALPKQPVLFQQIVFERGGKFATSVIVGTENKLYSLFRYPEGYAPVEYTSHNIESETEAYGFTFYTGKGLWEPKYNTPLETGWEQEMFGADNFEEYPAGVAENLIGGYGWSTELYITAIIEYAVGSDSLESYEEGPISTLFGSSSNWSEPGGLTIV